MMTPLDWALLTVGAAALTYGFAPEGWIQAIKRPFVGDKKDDEDQWVNVANVVDYMVAEYESYRILGSEEQSKKRAFQDLHKRMCKGDVRVRGALTKSSKKSIQLHPKLCRKLKPVIVGSAIGSVYNLMDPAPDPPAEKTEGPYGKGEVRWEGQGIYDDLSVNRRDIFKCWPERTTRLEQSSSDGREIPTKRQIQKWMEFIETYELDWKSNRLPAPLNIVYEPTWGEMRPFLQEDTIEASQQQLMPMVSHATIMSRKPLNSAIDNEHFKGLVRRDLLSLLRQNS